jgi:hypothetical protein
MTTVRISTQHGMRAAELLEQAGDWAITRYGQHIGITHLISGYAVKDSHKLDHDKRRELLFKLAGMPSADLQQLPLKAIDKMAKQVAR